MDNAEVAEVVRTARAVLRDGAGWVQGTYGGFDLVNGGEPVYCVMGALRVAVGGDPWTVTKAAEPTYDAARLAVWEVVHEQYPDYLQSVMTWNDRPGRTWEEVAAVLDKAIARLEEAV